MSCPWHGQFGCKYHTRKIFRWNIISIVFIYNHLIWEIWASLREAKRKCFVTLFWCCLAEYLCAHQEFQVVQFLVVWSSEQVLEHIVKCLQKMLRIRDAPLHWIVDILFKALLPCYSSRSIFPLVILPKSFFRWFSREPKLCVCAIAKFILRGLKLFDANMCSWWRDQWITWVKSWCFLVLDLALQKCTHTTRS